MSTSPFSYGILLCKHLCIPQLLKTPNSFSYYEFLLKTNLFPKIHTSASKVCKKGLGLLYSIWRYTSCSQIRAFRYKQYILKKYVRLPLSFIRHSTPVSLFFHSEWPGPSVVKSWTTAVAKLCKDVVVIIVPNVEKNSLLLFICDCTSCAQPFYSWKMRSRGNTLSYTFKSLALVGVMLQISPFLIYHRNLLYLLI